jgi:hypothetical protein
MIEAKHWGRKKEVNPFLNKIKASYRLPTKLELLFLHLMDEVTAAFCWR